MTALEQTPSQTVGPFFHDGLVHVGQNIIAAQAARGSRIVLLGQIIDGDGQPVPDALIEVWQADAGGIYPHPADPRHAEADPQCRGFGRSDTRHAGTSYRFETIKPGRVLGPDGAPQAPHLCVRIFARGLLTHLVTRMYFADEPAANEADAVLQLVPAGRRGTLLAERDSATVGPPVYRWDITLQGPNETVFFQP